MSKIDELLEKRGIKDVSMLDESEKQTFDRWQKIWSEGEITVDKLKQLCINQIFTIEHKWRDLDNSELKNQRLIAMHTVYKTILDAMEKPAAERENLEKHLAQLIES